MIRKLIGAAIGASVAKKHPAAGGVTGAVLASAVPFVLTRLSLPAMVGGGRSRTLLRCPRRRLPSSR